jgi:hypothetical protein
MHISDNLLLLGVHIVMDTCDECVVIYQGFLLFFVYILRLIILVFGITLIQVVTLLLIDQTLQGN